MIPSTNTASNARSGSAIAVMVPTWISASSPRLVQRELYPSKEVLDGAIASGMEHGMRETLEQLEALLPELALT